MKHLKKTLLPLAAAALLLVSLAACGSNNADPSTNDGSADTPSSNQEGATGDTVAKEDCSSVYAEIIAVNGSHLSVSAGDQVLDLTVKDDILTKWTQGDQVILYYTGDFGEDMQVRYIDKWTENSDVQRPENQENADKGNTDSSVLDGICAKGAACPMDRPPFRRAAAHYFSRGNRLAALSSVGIVPLWAPSGLSIGTCLKSSSAAGVTFAGVTVTLQS